MLLRALCLVCMLGGLAPPPQGCAQQRIVGQKYAVASGHPEATDVGLQVLRQGGNVVDAAVATSLALGVAEPYGSGLGGKLVLLHRDGATGKLTSIVALCASPAALDDLEFIELSKDERTYGYQAVGVPGLVAGLDEAHRRWGSLPWAAVVEPAAELADRGVTINATMRSMFLPKVKALRRDEEAAGLYLVDGEAPEPGTRMRNADLASSLRAIASGGARAFYDGPIAQQIVRAAQAGGAPLALDDFRNYRAEVGAPLVIRFGNCQVYSCPPPLTGGVTVLSALKCLEPLRDSIPLRDDVIAADRMGRVLQCIYPEISRTIADVPAASEAATRLLSDEYAREVASRAMQLDPRQPYPRARQPAPVDSTSEALPSASTSHLLVVDRAGNMVSLTQSLSLHFGACVVPPDTGILLNDSMSNFATHNRAAANHAGAGKRARSTIAPIIATRDGKPWLALGIPGGQRIPTTTLQLLWRLLVMDAPLDATFAASRFHLRRPLNSDEPPNVVDYEDDASPQWVERLASLGWRLEARRRNGHYFGGGSAAQYRADGSLVGVADPRRTNSVAGD
jgi:gamma-glutamyltranspeptidase/glutathione hydrolase